MLFDCLLQQCFPWQANKSDPDKIWSAALRVSNSINFSSHTQNIQKCSVPCKHSVFSLFFYLSKPSHSTECESLLAWKESTIFVLWPSLPGLTWMVIRLKWACVEISPVFCSTMLYCGPFALSLAGRWNHATLHLSCPDGSGILSQRITSQTGNGAFIENEVNRLFEPGLRLAPFAAV